MKFISFIKDIFTSQSGVSSKRVCGVLGWLVCLGIMIYCTIEHSQAPNMIDVMIVSILGLLGIDSVTSIWKNKK